MHSTFLKGGGGGGYPLWIFSFFFWTISLIHEICTFIFQLLLPLPPSLPCPPPVITPHFSVSFFDTAVCQKLCVNLWWTDVLNERKMICWYCECNLNNDNDLLKPHVDNYLCALVCVCVIGRSCHNHHFCHDKSFVTTNICQNKIYLLQQAYFCCKKKRHVLFHKTFVATEMILVAAPANDMYVCVFVCVWEYTWIWEYT